MLLTFLFFGFPVANAARILFATSVTSKETTGLVVLA